MKKQTTIRFVVHRKRINFGSAELRVVQLIRILEQQLGSRVRIEIEKLPRRRGLGQELWALRQKPGDVIVFAKISLPELRSRVLDILRYRGALTCLDYVDSDLRLVTKRRADVHIAASESALRKMRDLISQAEASGAPVSGQPFLLHHNTDARLAGLKVRPSDSLNAVYFGDIRNTIISASIAKRISVLNIDRADQIEDASKTLPDYNLHYCVRRMVEEEPGDIVAKPFTKGFIAAQMGAPVLINKDVDDAVELLGNDYPFLIADNSETAILDGLDLAEDAYGGPAWQEALSRMAQMRQVFSHEAIARQFGDILDYLT
ncbi:hypothetical protein [uncultured Roseobacter sp.]|uniref:hypothetical protein n=1 Tax=uncultured Roseobacter sp. TaxID=114847 RepID=UPI002637A224|nr:hypothetical protein [uncultured Roseobacter sp.]